MNKPHTIKYSNDCCKSLIKGKCDYVVLFYKGAQVGVLRELEENSFTIYPVGTYNTIDISLCGIDISIVFDRIVRGYF